jgi:hypothetical protein
MVGFMKANGKMINKTAKEGFVIEQDNGELASGKMVISYNDFFISLSFLIKRYEKYFMNIYLFQNCFYVFIQFINIEEND